MGYQSILERVRVEVPVKHYGTEHMVDGEIPEWLSQKLPLFGSEDGDETYMNSGGRGILLENGGEVYRIKGVDPKGIITRIVASSDKNIIADVRQSVSQCPNKEKIEEMLTIRRNHSFPSYKDKPFSFLTKTAAERSKYVFDILGEGYEKYGLSHPSIYRASIAYKNLRWDGEPIRSIVFQLPDIESDLREDELSTLMLRHLQHASVKQLRDIKDEFTEFYRSLLKWHAFDCRILADHSLVPTPESRIGQNHLIAHVSDGKIGLVRVDHTSTQTENVNEGAKELYERITGFEGILSTFASHILLALEMAKMGVKYDGERYSNYFDAAFKFHDVQYHEWPETMKFLMEGIGCFSDAFKAKEPEPIEESEMVELFNIVTSIEIDQEFEQKRAERYRKIREKMGI